MSASADPTRRFSDRAGHYAQWRPRYPRELIGFFKSTFGLSAGRAIADIGSGTGLLTELLVEVGSPVYAVEPNAEMRGVAERNLGGNPAFHSVDATAENITLANGSVDLVAAAQAFHWFDRTRAKTEFVRILKPGGAVALVWNERRADQAGFAAAYQGMIDAFRGDAAIESYRTLGAGKQKAFAEFFAPGGFEIARFDNHQVLDLPGLIGRVLSTSSMPLAGDARHEPLMGRIRQMFEQFQVGGVVRIEYDTRVYHGRLS